MPSSDLINTRIQADDDKTFTDMIMDDTTSKDGSQSKLEQVDDNESASSSSSSNFPVAADIETTSTSTETPGLDGLGLRDALPTSPHKGTTTSKVSVASLSPPPPPPPSSTSTSGSTSPPPSTSSSSSSSSPSSQSTFVLTHSPGAASPNFVSSMTSMSMSNPMSVAPPQPTSSVQTVPINGGVAAAPPYTTRKQQPAAARVNAAVSSSATSTPSPSTTVGKSSPAASSSSSTSSLSPSPSVGSSILGATAAAAQPSSAADVPSNLTTTPPTPPPYPALHLLPLNDTFVPKQISLYPPGQRIKIGRQTNAKTIPNGTNGYFDSKVLSRMHAEVWAEDGKVLIKDVKSSNGTFIDGQRLSPEAAESDIFELKSGMTVEFGIDIVSDDGKSIVHHKVSTKVLVVMNAEEVQISSREFNNWYRFVEAQPAPRRAVRQIALGLGGGNNNLANQHQQSVNIDHFIGKLQTELQKSRETAAHLSEVSSTLNDVQDTLGGGVANGPLPPPGAPAAFFSRELTNGQANAQQQALAHQQHTQSIAQLQTQLTETQQSLAGHVGKMRDLEGLLAEHEAMKKEVGTLKRQMEEDALSGHLGVGSDGDLLPPNKSSDRAGRESPIAALLEAQERDDELDDDDDDANGRHHLGTYRRDEENGDEDGEADESDDDARSILSVDTVLAGGARGIRANRNGFKSAKGNQRGLADLGQESQLQEQNVRLNARLDELASELDEAIKLGQVLRSQQAEASTTIEKLQEQIVKLEQKVEQRIETRSVGAPTSSTLSTNPISATFGEELEKTWVGWKETFEKSWQREKEDWQSEREKLRSVVAEWEEKKKATFLSSSSEEDNDEEDDERGPSGMSDTNSSGLVGGIVAAAAAGGTLGNLAASKSKKRSKRRRKTFGANVSSGLNETNAESPIPSVSSPSTTRSPLNDSTSTSTSSPTPARLAKLTRSSRANEVASDSDSTIGSRAAFDTGEATIKRGQKSGISIGSTHSGDALATNSAASNREGAVPPRQKNGDLGPGLIVIQQKHVTSAVVVVVGVLAAMAVSFKVKE